MRLALGAKRKRTQKRAKCDAVINWGNTERFPINAKVVLNTPEAVSNASNKLRMLNLMKEAGIDTLNFTNNPDEVDGLRDEAGGFYVRDKSGVVRYDTVFNPFTDLYVSQPIENKRREYRVQVFNGKIMGIYEKVPNEMAENPESEAEIPKLFKSFTCKFKRCDPSVSRVDQNAQELCVRAVHSLGLLFGGVDLIMSKGKKFTVCEVNSAPGLNSNNVEKWTAEIKAYVQEKLNETNSNGESV